MNISKFNPFNWLRHEQGESDRPVTIGEKNQPQGNIPAPITDLHREMNRLFDEFSRSVGFSSSAAAQPSGILRPQIDIEEKDDRYIITADLPGVSNEDVTVEVRGETLRISGEKQNETEETGRNYHRIERSYGSFLRVLNLPEDVEVDGIEATFRNGVMTVDIPRKTDEQSSRKIDVKTGE